jgi:undecaprenyl-diphosphatase
VATGLLVFGTGVIAPPDLEQLLRDAGQTLGPLTYVFVGALVFLETGAFVGFVLPGETAILVGGMVAGQGEIELLPLLAVVWACALAGDLTSFALGRRLGRGFLLRHGARVGITSPRVDRVEAFFARHGGKTVLLGRNVGVVRPVMPFLAGSSGMPLRRFLAYDAIGVAVWGAYNALLGYVFWRSFDLVATWASRGALALAALIAIAVTAVVAVRFLRVPANRRRARDRVRELLARPARGADMG